jgi:hypothetical protein
MLNRLLSRTRQPAAAAMIVVAVAAVAVGGVAMVPLAAGATHAGPAAARPWRITTVAGGTGGPGPASQIAAGDCALAFSRGYLYAADTGFLQFSNFYGYAPSVIRRISISTGQLSTAAGAGYGGYGRTTPDGTPAAQAALGPSCGVTPTTTGT